MNLRPSLVLQNTSTMLFLPMDVRGTRSGDMYSMSAISSPAGSGKSEFKRLATRFGCSPNTFLKVKSAFGSRYLAISFASVLVQGYNTPTENTTYLTKIAAGLQAAQQKRNLAETSPAKPL